MTVYVVQCSRDYEGSDVAAIYTDEHEARRYAFDRQQEASQTETYSVTPWTGGPGQLEECYEDSWQPPKKPRAPEEPREYTEAKRRHAEQLAAYERGCREFLGE